ncbi:MAG: EamA family transporter [Oscillospiraceae bacterium]|jgi:transporter family protein|nr:EamA family transporter [Oscillospiraceae bacterium]MBQ8930792.1 EamA family transporter [Oscillospiraceae bacterium]
MWFVYILISAIFSAASTIFIKLGVRHTDSTLATGIKTVVVTVLSWAVVFATGLQGELGSISGRTMLFLVLSGLTTGGSWLCNYGALKLGEVDTMVAVMRCGMVLAVIFSFIFLRDPFSVMSVVGIAFILAGALLMIDRRSRSSGAPVSKKWLLLALGEMLFASTTTILGKVGITGVNSNLGTAIHSVVVLVMTAGLVAVTGKWRQIPAIPRRELLFIVLSGVASAVTWLTYYRGLQLTMASIVAPADKLLSGAAAVVMAYFVFGERLTKRSALALGCVAAGTVCMIL